MTETRAARRAQLEHLPPERLEQQRSARVKALHHLPPEVQKLIFSYAVDGGGRSLLCIWWANRVRYYQDECVDISLLEDDPSQDPATPAIEQNFGSLKNANVDSVLLRLKREKDSTIGSLCTFTYNVWRTLPVEVNTFVLLQATAIAGLSQDLGKDGQLSLRAIDINVVDRKEAHGLRQVSLFQHLRTLVIRIPHPAFVHTAQPRWRGLVNVLFLAYNLKDLTEFEITCVDKCVGCTPFNDITRKQLYNQWP